MKTLTNIEGIGEKYAAILRAAGIKTVDALLDAAADPRSRGQLAEKTALSPKLILKWANMADLCRVRGVAGQYAELLERVGVDTIKELARRNPPMLHAKMRDFNAAHRVVRQVPSLSMVVSWVDNARTLTPRISH